jgi:DNA-binding NarL/FixJ family response regulator
MRAVDELDHGRESYRAGAWSDAYDLLSRADEADPLEAPDLELLARAAYMLGLDDAYVSNLERAHHSHLDSHDVPQAVRCGFWIGHNFLFRGETVEASAWFTRSHSLLDRSNEDCVERGYLLIPLWLRQMSEGDFGAGFATARDAATIAERFDDSDLLWLARDEQARALLVLGRIDEGLRLVEETLAVANAGDLSPIVTGIVYCNTIAFCQSVYELHHARACTGALTRWCGEQPEMVAHNGLCLVHQAEIMQLNGAWADALEQARNAAEQFTRGVLNELAIGKAFYRQAEVHRLRGETEAAELAYRAASSHGADAQPGLALMRLAQGEGARAAGAIRRALDEASTPLQRAALLPAFVEIALGLGKLDEAELSCRELEEIAHSRSSDALTAVSAHATGAAALARGDSSAALESLRRAVAAWQKLSAPYGAARSREMIGLACRMLGDEETAVLELEAAGAAYEQLGAKPDADRIRGPLAGGRDTHTLTGRELEVLRLVAAGKSNHAIALELVVSDHTVRRHLQNIFRKLGVSSRTAATAFAFEHELL